MERKYLGVIGHKNLVRDDKSKGILNVDSEGLNKYQEERNLKRKMKQVLEDYEEIKSDVIEIKCLLQKLLESQNTK